MGISKFKHIYEAELQLSTRFPFHCQDRLRAGGRREALRLAESAMDVALFIASWKEVLKGLGVRGKGAPGCPW